MWGEFSTARSNCLNADRVHAFTCDKITMNLFNCKCNGYTACGEEDKKITGGICNVTPNMNAESRQSGNPPLDKVLRELGGHLGGFRLHESGDMKNEVFLIHEKRGLRGPFYGNVLYSDTSLFPATPSANWTCYDNSTRDSYEYACDGDIEAAAISTALIILAGIISIIVALWSKRRNSRRMAS